MRRLLLLVSSIVIASQATAASNVNTVSDFAISFRRLAIAPAISPTRIDPVWVEGLLQEKLALKGIQAIPSTVVRKGMFDLGIQKLDDASMAKLAKSLECDAFLIPIVKSSEVESEGAVGGLMPYTGSFYALSMEVARGGVELAIVRARDGKVLLQGVASGYSDMRSERGVIGKIFSDILDQAFTRKVMTARSALPAGLDLSEFSDEDDIPFTVTLGEPSTVANVRRIPITVAIPDSSLRPSDNTGERVISLYVQVRTTSASSGITHDMKRVPRSRQPNDQSIESTSTHTSMLALPEDAQSIDVRVVDENSKRAGFRSVELRNN